MMLSLAKEGLAKSTAVDFVGAKCGSEVIFDD